MQKTRCQKGNLIASVIKRGNKLRIRYVHPETRKTVEKSTGLNDTPENRKLIKIQVLPKLEAKIALGQLDNPSKAEPFEIYAEKYKRFMNKAKSYHKVRINVDNIIIPRFKGKVIDTITRDDIRDFAAELVQTRKIKTVKNILIYIRGIFKMASSVVKDNPALKVELPPVDEGEIIRPEPFKPEEVNAIIASIDEEFYRNFVAIGFYTGMRTGEILGLMHKDIDFDKRIIKVRRRVSNGVVSTTKTGAGIREIPLFNAVFPYFKSQIKLSKHLYLFTNNGVTWFGAETISNKRWERALNKANVDYRQPYTMRHTFISSMLKSGKLSLLEVARMVGHSNIEMIVKNYARYIDGEQLKIERDFDLFGSNSGDGFGDRISQTT